MRTLLDEMKLDQIRNGIANGLYKSVNVNDRKKANAWSAFSSFLAELLFQHKKSKQGFEPLNPEKIKGVWPKGYVIKKKDLK